MAATQSHLLLLLCAVAHVSGTPCKTVLVTGTAGRVSGTYELNVGDLWANKPYYTHKDNGLLLYAVMGTGWRIGGGLGLRDTRIQERLDLESPSPESRTNKATWAPSSKLKVLCVSGGESQGHCDGEGCNEDEAEGGGGGGGGGGGKYSGSAASVTLVGRFEPLEKEIMNGVYHRTAQSSNGHPVYIKTTADKYISVNEYKQWIVTPEKGIGTNSGWGFVDSDGFGLDSVPKTTEWKFPNAKKEWVADPAVKILPGQHRAFRLSGRKGNNAVINGDYKPTAQMSNGRPVYIKTSGKPGQELLYLHWNPDKSWSFSGPKDVGTRNAFCFTFDPDGNEPASFGTKSWKVTNANSEWVDDPSLVIEPIE